MLQESIKNATSEIEKKKLSQAKDVLLKIKESEEQQNKIDQEDIAKLEDMMKAL
jgi:hypothetical protein